MPSKIKFSHILMIALWAMIVIGCQGKKLETSLEAKKKGGIYELAQVGHTMRLYNDPSQNFIVDTTTAIKLQDFEFFERKESPFKGTLAFRYRVKKEAIVKLQELTSRNLGKQICVVIMDRVIAVPMVSAVATHGEGEIILADDQGINELFEYLDE